MADLVPFRWRDLPANEREAAHERRLRTLVCPTCHARRGEGCNYDHDFVGGTAVRYSHTGRYNHAARRWLVPAMGGA